MGPVVGARLPCRPHLRRLRLWLRAFYSASLFRRRMSHPCARLSSSGQPLRGELVTGQVSGRPAFNKDAGMSSRICRASPFNATVPMAPGDDDGDGDRAGFAAQLLPQGDSHRKSGDAFERDRAGVKRSSFCFTRKTKSSFFFCVFDNGRGAAP